MREESPFEYLLCGEREGCERETERLLSGVSFAAVTPTAAGDGLGKLRRELYGALQYRPFLQSGVVRTDRRAERTEWGTYRGYLESLKRLFSEGVHGMEVPEKLLSGLFSAGLADYGPEVLGQIKDETDFLFRARFGEDLRECALRDFSSAEEIVRRYLGILERNAEGRPYGYGKMAKALAYIDGHVTEKIDLAYVANLVDLNYYYFSRYFKRETGHEVSRLYHGKENVARGETPRRSASEGV